MASQSEGTTVKKHFVHFLGDFHPVSLSIVNRWVPKEERAHDGLMAGTADASLSLTREAAETDGPLPFICVSV